MDTQVTQPYDITNPPIASYPLEYSVLWVAIAFLLIISMGLIWKKYLNKQRSKKQIEYLLESFACSTVWNDNNIRSGLAVITKTARRYGCDPALIGKTEQILFMNQKDSIPNESREIAKQLASQVLSKLREKKSKK
jgi:hypothetical protein